MGQSALPMPFDAVNGALAELLAAVQGALGAHLIGVYLGGSLALGDFDQTFAWLEKDVQAHASLMASMMADPFFDPIRSDARYAKLMRRIGII